MISARLSPSRSASRFIHPRFLLFFGASEACASGPPCASLPAAAVDPAACAFWPPRGDARAQACQPSTDTCTPCVCALWSAEVDRRAWPCQVALPMQRARPPTRTKTQMQMHAHGHAHVHPRTMRHTRESTQCRRAFRRAFGHGRARAGDGGSTSHGSVFFFSSALSALRALCAFFAAFFSSRLRLRSSCRACAAQGHCMKNVSALLTVPSKNRQHRKRCATYHRGWFRCRRRVRCCLHSCLPGFPSAARDIWQGCRPRIENSRQVMQVKGD